MEIQEAALEELPRQPVLRGARRFRRDPIQQRLQTCPDEPRVIGHAPGHGRWSALGEPPPDATLGVEK
ncbi:hypothetical protein EBZ80_05375 [bacterium]|nr:hypothetical protein [bacterium]